MCDQVLTKAQVAQFRRAGFATVPNFFSESEIRAIRSALSRIVRKGRLANVSTAGDGETHTKVAKNLQLCPLSPEADIFRSLPLASKVARAVQQLLTDDSRDNICCYLSQTFWKPANGGWGTSWHQDNAYFKIPDSTKGLGMWIAVHDATVKGGTLEVIPMTGNRGKIFPHVRESSSDHHITCKAHVENSRAVPLSLPAGGVNFFAYDVPHCTRTNRENYSRAAVAYHFLHMGHFLPRQFPLPEEAKYATPIVAGKDAMGGEEVYGRILDTFSWDTKKELRNEVLLQAGEDVRNVREVVQDSKL